VHRSAIGVGVVLLAELLLASAPGRAQTPSAGVAQPILREAVFDGATVFSPSELRWWLDLVEGEPLPRSPGDLSASLERRYHREGYAKTRVEGSFDETSGTLRFQIDEGRIDEIDFEGVEPPLRDRLQADFDVRPGDIYHERHVERALARLLSPMRGAIRSVGHDVITRGGRRVLVAQLRREKSRGRFVLGTDAREDWYNPVDGFAPGAGFTLTLFDQRRFNHTFVRGLLSYKFAREEAGYSIGVERPILGGPERPRVYLGVEAHELTATDDEWRLSNLEQSLAAVGFRNSFRDYHERRGYQVHGAFRFHPAQEVIASWRDDRVGPLANTADYSLFRDDHEFRPNQIAAAGKLRALVLGYTLDTRGLETESLERTYERQLLGSLLGSSGARGDGWRIEWTSELSPSNFGGDFGFSRHILNARGYIRAGDKHELRLRGMTGFSGGALPPQRQFAIGGIGTVHGYAFKESIGEGMVLLNGEYHFGIPPPRTGMRLLAFFDAGRVWSPIGGSRDDWLTGVGTGLELGDLRLDLGWRLNDIPKSFQMLVRFGPTF
jgi:hypothetical protein